jgi:hypothetical protein
MCRNISGQMADGRGCRSIPEIKTDQVKVTRSLGRIARFHLPKGILACQQLGSTILRVGATRQSIKIYSILFYFIVTVVASAVFMEGGFVRGTIVSARKGISGR